MHTAKTVSDAVCGGLIVLSETARLQLVQGASSKALPLNAALLHVGGFIVQDDHAQSRVRGGQKAVVRKRAFLFPHPLSSLHTPLICSESISSRILGGPHSSLPGLQPSPRPPAATL
jgi:hypothetical protein